jgi:hypothetical protein
MPSVITRGTPIEDAEKLTEDITISAYYHTPSASDGDQGTTVFQDETLSAPDHNTLASGTKYYWPQSGSMDFYAIYPKSDAITYDAKNKALTYTMPTDTKDQQDNIVAAAEKQKDIMVAHKSYDKMPTDQTAELGFDHICAQLTFKLAGSVLENAIIENVTITNLKTQGTYSLTDGKWTNLDETEIGDVSTGNIVKVTQIGGTTQTSKFNLKEKTLLLIPQELTSDSEIRVQVGEYETYTENKVEKYKITNESVWTCNFSTFTMTPGGNYVLEISKKGDIDKDNWEWIKKGNVVYEEFDSFYFIKEYQFDIDANTKEWFVVSDADWITFSPQESTYQKLGFWVDEEKGYDYLSGTNTGTITVYAYCEENVAKYANREATIMLVEDGKLTDCKFMRQLKPIDLTSYYTANTGYGKAVSTWGLYDGWGEMTFTSDEDWSTLTGITSTNTSDGIYLSTDKKTLTINFSKTNDYVHTVTESAGGGKNTTNMFFHTAEKDATSNEYKNDNKGYWYMMQMAIALCNNPKVTCTKGELNTFLDCAIMRAVQYNKFTLKEVCGVKVPDITELKWSLPSKDEISKDGVTSGVTYWTSTGSKETTTTTTGYGPNQQTTEVTTYLAWTFKVSGNSTTTATAERTVNTNHIRAIRYKDSTN